MSESLDPADHENSSDWRESVNQNRWYEIEVYHLSETELLELEQAIIAFLPERLRGDGVDNWIGPIPKHEAQTRAEYDAAFLLGALYRRLDMLRIIQESPKGVNDPDHLGLFSEPLEIAEAILRNAGIDYQGWRETYLYFSKKYDCWIQLDSALGKKFNKKRMEFDLREISQIDGDED